MHRTRVIEVVIYNETMQFIVVDEYSYIFLNILETLYLSCNFPFYIQERTNYCEKYLNKGMFQSGI